MDNMRPEREPRISRPYMVRINEDLSADPPRWNMVTAKNISASGILFNFDHYLEPGTRVGFRISLPFCPALECEGVVVRNVTGNSRSLHSQEQVVCAVAATFDGLQEKEFLAMSSFFSSQLSGNEMAGSQGPRATSGAETRHQRIHRSYVTRIRLNEDAAWQMVATQNLSASGALFTHTEPLTVSDEIHISMTLPFFELPVYCRGQVVRVQDLTRPTAITRRFSVAVRFSEMSENVQLELIRQGGRIGQG
jgi:hypothetical protein